MNTIMQGYLDKFVDDFELDVTNVSTNFEKFCAHCVLKNEMPEIDDNDLEEIIIGSNKGKVEAVSKKIIFVLREAFSLDLLFHRRPLYTANSQLSNLKNSIFIDVVTAMARFNVSQFADGKNL